MYWAVNLILMAALTVGGIGYHSSIMRSYAVIYFPDRHIERVRVVNHGDNFCPLNCKVQHRHRVHDIRWSCAATAPCKHFTVLHVAYRGEENRLAALEKELGDAVLGADTHIMEGSSRQPPGTARGQPEPVEE